MVSRAERELKRLADHNKPALASASTRAAGRKEVTFNISGSQKASQQEKKEEGMVEYLDGGV